MKAKPAWQSKTIIGWVLTVAAFLYYAYFREVTDPGLKPLLDQMFLYLGGAGYLLVPIGRATAKQPLKIKLK